MKPEVKYERKVVQVSDIKFDQSNPNKMSEAKQVALRNSIKEFGYVQEIVIDKNTMEIADGEHRLKQLIELGNTEVEVLIYPFKDEVQKKIFRQIANKLHGEHDFELDLAEYRKILDANGEDYKVLMGFNEREMKELRELIEKGNLTLKGSEIDRPTMEGHLEVYLRGNIKQIVLYFTQEEFVNIVPRIQKALSKTGLEDNSKFFMLLLEKFEKENNL